MNPNSGVIKTPLIVNSEGIQVTSNLVTNNIKISANAGSNKVLVSDANGNGIWTNVSSINYTDNDWFMHSGMMISNPDFRLIGVHAEEPLGEFQINDGAGKVSLGSVNHASFNYGNGYLGFNAVRTLDNPARWIFNLDHEGKNGGGVIWSDMDGSLNFATVRSSGGSKSIKSAEDNQILSDNDVLNQSKMTITPTGSVGIGTKTPTQKLEICHSDETGGIVINQVSNDSKVNTDNIRFERNGVEKYALGYYISGKPSFFIWNHIIQRTSLFISDQNQVGIDTEWPNAKLDVNGDLHVADRIGIGCDAPVDNLYKLFVEGGIEARDVKVTIKTFPDYVFSKSYKLISLDDLAKYIENNKHLPGLSPSIEVENNNGFELGAMEVKMVEKIEEQTRYILDLQKQINDLKQEISLLIKK